MNRKTMRSGVVMGKGRSGWQRGPIFRIGWSTSLSRSWNFLMGCPGLLPGDMSGNNCSGPRPQEPQTAPTQ